MKSKLYILILLVFALANCQEENQPPVIQNITASPQKIKTGETTQLTCVATDPDGDQLTYTWSAPKGTFPNGTSGSSIAWKAPDEGGTISISVIVSDGKNVTNGSVSVTIEVNPILSVTPTSLEFGSTSTQQTFDIKNSGTGSITWSISESLSWLTVSPQSGETTTETDKITVTINRNGVSPGNYSGKIIVTYNGGNQEINVTMDVEETGTIEGYVYYSGTTIPVSGVTVEIAGINYTTGESGYYLLEKINAGNYLLSASKLNFGNYLRNLTISKGKNSLNIELTSDLYTKNVSGIVSDEDGGKISGVLVSLLNPDKSVSNLKTTTDATGYYQLPSVPQGSRIITFEKNNYFTHQADIFISNNDYPYDAKLEFYKIFGIISDFGGDLLSGIAVSILQTDGSKTNYTTISDNNGYYQLKNVPQGNWIILFEKAGFSSYRSDITIAYNNGYFEFNSRLYHSITDSRDGKTYKIIKIGNQEWMAENLAYLPSVSPSSQRSSTTPYYYVYGYNGIDVNAAKATDYYKTYGVLYNWPAAMAGAASSGAMVQGVCPAGWHLPSFQEWGQLSNYLINNGYNYDGTTTDNKIAKSMAATILWESSNQPGAIGNNLAANNKSGFSALPGGLRHETNIFSAIGRAGYWWSSTKGYPNGAYYWYLGGYYYSDIGIYNGDKDYGLSIRCVRD